MKKYLVADLGNSRTKTGYFQEGSPPEFRIFTELDSDFGNYCRSLSPDAVLISSTASAEQEKKLAGFFPKEDLNWLHHKMVSGIQWSYPEPEKLGKDRLASLAAAKEKWPGRVLCVADAGTCLTLDFLDAEGKHLGGIISPGMDMRLESMHRFTAGLPRAVSADFAGIFGKSTLACLASGAVTGMVAEIEYHFKYLKINHSAVSVLILTGGNAEYLAHHLNSPNFVAPHLVLEGLYFILRSLR